MLRFKVQVGLAFLGYLFMLSYLLSGCRPYRQDLRPFKLDASVQAPDGATVRMDSLGVDVVIQKGNGFRMRISPQEVDLKGLVREMSKNSLNRITQIVVSEPQTLIYQSEIAHRTEYHFVSNVQVGSAKMSCQEDFTTHSHTLSEIKTMLATCKTLALP